MTIQEIFALPPDEQVKAFQQVDSRIPKWDELAKQYLPENHDIIAKKGSLRPTPTADKKGKIKRVSTIAIPEEQKIVDRVVQFLMANKVQREFFTPDTGKDETDIAADLMTTVYKKTGWDADNINLFKAYFGACQAMRVWYLVDTGVEHTEYGEPTRYKLRFRSYSPMPTGYSRINEAAIYPLYDDFGDMTALSFAYSVKVGDKDIETMETLTAESIVKYQKGDGGWELAKFINPMTCAEVDSIENGAGKITAILWWDTMPIYKGIEPFRDGKEFNLSYMADNVQENVAPTWVFTGEPDADAMAQPTTPTNMWILKAGGEFSTIAPTIDISAQDTLNDTLSKQQNEVTQYPAFTLDQMQGLGTASGSALRRILTDPMLKTGEVKYAIIRGFEREFSVIKALLSIAFPNMADAIKALEADFDIIPFVFDTKAEQQEADLALVRDNIMSRQTFLIRMGWTPEDAQQELVRLANEQNMMSGMGVTDMTNDITITEP